MDMDKFQYATPTSVAASIIQPPPLLPHSPLPAPPVASTLKPLPSARISNLPTQDAEDAGEEERQNSPLYSPAQTP